MTTPKPKNVKANVHFKILNVLTSQILLKILQIKRLFMQTIHLNDF